VLNFAEDIVLSFGLLLRIAPCCSSHVNNKTGNYRLAFCKFSICFGSAWFVFIASMYLCEFHS
jgi:hypothetical protein